MALEGYKGKTLGDATMPLTVDVEQYLIFPNSTIIETTHGQDLIQSLKAANLVYDLEQIQLETVALHNFEVDPEDRLTSAISDGGMTFVRKWIDIVRNHAAFREHASGHQEDLSLANLMYNPAKNTGVFVDYDVALPTKVESENRKEKNDMFGLERIRTNPFTALDVLGGECRGRDQPRHYHHQLEALIWMLLFVVVGWQKSTKRISWGPDDSPYIWRWYPTFDATNSCDMRRFFLDKSLKSMTKINALDWNKDADSWHLARILCTDLAGVLKRRMQRRVAQLKSEGEVKDEDDRDESLSKLCLISDGSEGEFVEVDLEDMWDTIIRKRLGTLGLDKCEENVSSSCSTLLCASQGCFLYPF